MEAEPFCRGREGETQTIGRKRERVSVESCFGFCRFVEQG